MNQDNTPNGTPDAGSTEYYEDDMIQIDDHQDAIEEEHNILREKTFNEELRSLVKQVTTEKSSGKLESEDLSDISEEDLVVKFHSLFYRAVCLEDIEDSYTVFNPFFTDNIHNQEIIVDVIKKIMDLHGYKNFSLLDYNLRKKCFLPTINFLDNADLYSLSIDIDDEIYTNLVDIPDGAIIDSQSIRSNNYLAKRFDANILGEDHFFYINILKHLYQEILYESMAKGIPEGLNKHLSSIILIKLKKNDHNEDTTVITENLRHDLPIPILLYCHHKYNRIIVPFSLSLRHTYNFLEYCYQYFSSKKNSRCFLISFKRVHSNEVRHLLSYMYSLLYDVLSSRSIILQIDKNHILTFSDHVEAQRVLEIINDWTELYDELISYKVLSDLGQTGFLQFLTTYIF